MARVGLANLSNPCLKRSSVAEIVVFSQRVPASFKSHSWISAWFHTAGGSIEWVTLVCSSIALYLSMMSANVAQE
jgi:hypothetical protein